MAKQSKAQKKTKKTVTKRAAPKSVAKRIPEVVHTNSLGIRILGDRVLVRPHEVETTTASGIIIPDTVKKEKVMAGVVVAVGAGRVSESGDCIPMTVQTGDVVYFNRGWDEDGNKFTWKDEDYFLVAESDVRAIIG